MVHANLSYLVLKLRPDRTENIYTKLETFPTHPRPTLTPRKSPVLPRFWLTVKVGQTAIAVLW